MPALEKRDHVDVLRVDTERPACVHFVLLVGKRYKVSHQLIIVLIGIVQLLHQHVLIDVAAAETHLRFAHHKVVVHLLDVTAMTKLVVDAFRKHCVVKFG